MRPLVPASRVVGLDVARCVALLGMVATHVLVSTEPDGDVTLVQQVAGGRSSALFAVLAGVSLALMSGGASPLRGDERRAASIGLAVRALLVLGLGLVLGQLPMNILVILSYYGVLFLLGIPFLGLRAPALAGLSAAALVVAPVASQWLRTRLPAAPIQNVSLGSLADPVDVAERLLLTGTYPALPWLAYLLAGMALGRLDLRRWGTTIGALVVGAVLAATSYVVSDWLLARPEADRALSVPPLYDGIYSFEQSLTHGFFGVTPTDSWWWLAIRAPHSSTPFDLAHTIGTSLLVIGLAMVVGRLLPRVSAVVFGAGAMTLTLYSLHVVLRTPALLPGDGATTYVQHVTILLVLGAIYRLARTSGPLERGVALAAGAARDAARS